MGIWKNFDELEESLSLPELDMIIKHKREKEHRDKQFAAAIQGIDIDKGAKSEVQRRIEEVKRRAEIKQRGEETVQQEEFADLGFGYQTV